MHRNAVGIFLNGIVMFAKVKLSWESKVFRGPCYIVSTDTGVLISPVRPSIAGKHAGAHQDPRRLVAYKLPRQRSSIQALSPILCTRTHTPLSPKGGHVLPSCTDYFGVCAVLRSRTYPRGCRDQYPVAQTQFAHYRERHVKPYCCNYTLRQGC